MFRLSKLFITLLLLIICSCSSEVNKIDADLFLGSGDGSSAPSLNFFSVTPLRGGNIEFETFEHFFNIALTRDTKTEGCGIPIETNTNERKTCLVEVNELDIFFHGLELEVNVPPEMCTYLAINNYWYYNYETGRGPRSIARTQNISVDGASTWACTSGGVSCNANPELSFDSDTGAVSCIYDHTNNGQPNCCLGRYNLNTTVITQIAGDGVEPPSSEIDFENEELEWGGDFAGCISGPGASSEWEATTRGLYTIPNRILYDTRAAGESVKIKILNPIDQGSRGNVFSSNFYTGLLDSAPVGSQNPHFRSETLSNGIILQTKLPLAIAPLVDRSGDPLPTANAAYSVSCLDEAYEVLQRIDTYIREWNTFDKYTEYVTSITNTSPEPDVEDEEDGIQCGRFTSGSPCNDKEDWDDLVGEYPGR